VTDPDVNPFADGCTATMVAYGGARPTDTHLLSRVHGSDEEIHAVLKREGIADELEPKKHRTAQEPLDGRA
jgi:hypothetical protein